MHQIIFEEFEFYGIRMYTCKTCEKCNNLCKVKSISKDADLVCKRYNK